MSPPDPLVVHVALVNDVEVIVRGLEQMLAPDERIEVVELDASVGVAEPVDVALFDTFSQPAGFGAIDRLLASENVGRVAVYSWTMDPELIEEAFAKGVAGYLSKSLSAAQIADAIIRVHGGERVVAPPHEIGRSDPPIRERDWPGRDAGLTAREAEVVAMITRGLSNNEIAEAVFLSINSVKSYIRSAYRTMGVTSRSQAVLWGIDHGFDRNRRRIIRTCPDQQ